MVVVEEVVVVEALEGAAGLPAVAFSRLHVEQHLVHLSLIVSPKTAILGEKLRNLPLIYDS